jgi:hypothetical protein
MDRLPARRDAFNEVKGFRNTSFSLSTAVPFLSLPSSLGRSGNREFTAWPFLAQIVFIVVVLLAGCMSSAVANHPLLSLPQIVSLVVGLLASVLVLPSPGAIPASGPLAYTASATAGLPAACLDIGSAWLFPSNTFAAADLSLANTFAAADRLPAVCVNPTAGEVDRVSELVSASLPERLPI